MLRLHRKRITKHITKRCRTCLGDRVAPPGIVRCSATTKLRAAPWSSRNARHRDSPPSERVGLSYGVKEAAACGKFSNAQALLHLQPASSTGGSRLPRIRANLLKSGPRLATARPPSALPVSNNDGPLLRQDLCSQRRSARMVHCAEVLAVQADRPGQKRNLVAD
jgi:hypothetical protein